MENDIARELRQIKWILAGILAALVVIAVAVAWPMMMDLLWAGLVLFVCVVAVYALFVVGRQVWAIAVDFWSEVSSLWRG